MISIAQFVVMPRRFVLEHLLTEVAKSNKGFISVAAAAPLMGAIKADSGGMGTQPTPPAPHKYAVGVVQLKILVAYIVTFVIVLVVLQRLYVHKYHYTPPSLRAYRQLIAERGLVQRRELLAWDNHQQLRPFTPIATGPHSAEGEEGGPSGASPERVPVEEDRGMHLSSEVLAWPEQDLRASSFRERERLQLSAAMGADLPPAIQSFYFSMRRSNASRAILPTEFALTSNDCLTSARQSARFSTQVAVSPSTSSSANALGGDSLPSDRRPIFFYPRSHSSRALLPSEFDLDDLNRASPNSCFTTINRSSASAPASARASPSTSRPGSYRWITSPASLTSTPPPNQADGL